MEARTNVQRLISTLEGPHSGEVTGSFGLGNAPINNKQLLASLREALREIDDSLVGLGPDDA
jgi:hypothetical protein